MYTRNKRSFLITPLVVVVLAMTAITTASADEARPFKGSLDAVETRIPPFGPPPFIVTGNGSGNATHLGSYTVSYTVAVVGGPTPGVIVGVGAAVFVAANGDTVSAKVAGLSTPTIVIGVRSIVETYTITGGSGRFAGASGSFVVKRTLNQITGVTAGAFEGHIVLPKKAP